MVKLNSAKEVLKLYDANLDLARCFGIRTKDFTKLIEQLEIFIDRMILSRKVSEEVKQEFPDISDEDFILEAGKRLVPVLNQIQKNMKKYADYDFDLLLFSLPENKGRRFFELMAELEDIEKLPLRHPDKRKKIDRIIESLKKYVLEIKAISMPFIPANIDPGQTIIFKVKFYYQKRVWRKIELKSTNTLKDLHDSIQESIGWCNDHLYSFFMDNKFKGDFDAEYTCPHESEGRKTADKAKVGLFGFSRGQKFAYLFDFGDMHKFEIEVVGFDSIDKNKRYPSILGSHGDAPKQYGY
ncbi:TPA: plasmid pRiA4b ORF-3 family protein [Candidatus Woesearchaeota archaeon]|nr:plasmid pRiA4b ORF-3 family protein [Candidatus Woesearchaeota archaeon]HIH55277.1 plasmid pRiA4b ORF-3 family protein [Candidatus Woesearchaeota archaeon]HIJ02426.1 plasmid pRiA4b ORF-3 family protein [Candidatus Woesearchaeota archaeon]HIJ13299.1 plasmid pRiA4b ORF-3 family protein [Candidatus Woesearchaeota archaeon]